MDRRKFLQISTAAPALCAAGTVGTTRAQDAKKPAAMTTGQPAVMAPRTDGAEIVWRINGLAKGYVEYGKTAQLGSVARDDGWGLRPAGKEVLKVRLDGLEEGTRYFYRVVTENFDHKHPKKETGTIRSFRTLSATAPETSFSIWNDTHQRKDTIRKLAAMTPAADFLLWNGDMSNDWYRDGEVAETLVTPGGGVDFTAKCPLVLLRGNHDLRGNHAWQVRDYTATPDGKPWCAFRSGPVAVICLDTGEDKADDNRYLFGRVACEPMRREQAQWLEKTILRPELRDAPYRIVFCHIPLRWTDEKTDYGYDWFSKRSRDLWHASLVKWGAQCIISGHTHADAFIPSSEEFPYAQLVGGGPRMEEARLLSGKADAKQLTLTTTDMTGKVTRTNVFKPLTS